MSDGAEREAPSAEVVVSRLAERRTLNLARADAARPAGEWLGSLPWDRPASLETMSAAELLGLL